MMVMNILLDKGSKFIENYMVIGDLNYDILTLDISQILDDLCDIFDLTNIKLESFSYVSFWHLLVR
jgi:hypothetical protein